MKVKQRKAKIIQKKIAEQVKNHHLVNKVEYQIKNKPQQLSIQIKFSPTFTLPINLPNSLTYPQLYDLINSYFYLHRKYGPRGSQFVGMIIKWKKDYCFVRNFIKAYFVFCQAMAIGEVYKDFQIMLKYQMPICQQIQLFDAFRNQWKWVRNVNIVQNHLFFNSIIQLEKTMHTQQFFITIQTSKMPQYYRLYYIPKQTKVLESKNNLKSQSQPPTLHFIKQLNWILQSCPQIFTYPLIQTFQTTQSYFFIFKYKLSLSIKDYILFVKNKYEKVGLRFLFNQIDKQVNQLKGKQRQVINRIASSCRLLQLFSIDVNAQITINNQFFCKFYFNFKSQTTTQFIQQSNTQLQTKNSITNLLKKQILTTYSIQDQFDQYQQVLDITQNKLLPSNQIFYDKNMILKAIQFQMSQKLNKLMENAPLSQIIKKCEKISLNILQILSSQQLLGIQNDDFSYIRPQQKLYLANEDINKHQKSTIKKLSKQKNQQVNKQQKNKQNQIQISYNIKTSKFQPFILKPNQNKPSKHTKQNQHKNI